MPGCSVGINADVQLGRGLGEDDVGSTYLVDSFAQVAMDDESTGIPVWSAPTKFAGHAPFRLMGHGAPLQPVDLSLCNPSLRRASRTDLFQTHTRCGIVRDRCYEASLMPLSFKLIR